MRRMDEPAQAIDAVIRAEAGDENAVFVFPSEIAASAYACRFLTAAKERGGGMTVPMDRFTAWDSFLQEAILPFQKGKKSISNTMRKMFAAIILEENAARAKKNHAPLFKSIIHPQYAQYLPSFTAWIAGVLPQLKIWAEYAAGLSIEQAGGVDVSAALDDESKDYLALIVRYTQFLEQNGLFESAWEKPPFTDNGKRYVLFFTETLADFPVYQNLLRAASPHVTIVQTPALNTEQGAFEPFFLKSAKSEITAAALYILQLHEAGMDYRDITVTSPSLETYEPYILDEFAAHQIPVQNGSGKPLSSYPAGCVFAALSACFSKKMAVGALSSLLLNRSIPWKDEDKINGLITYGLRNNCICSWENEDGSTADGWEKAFEKKPSKIQGYYRELKKTVMNMCSSSRFSKIRDHYFAFREKFIDAGKFRNDAAYFEADAVLGRCIAELSQLIQIEKTFPSIKIPSPWHFFVEHLNATLYKAQSASDGVNLLPYRISASVPSLCHIILGASQSAMPQIFCELSFLSGLKKKRCNIEDIDASGVFFDLHRFSSAKPAVFFCSQETFSGFAIPCNALGVLDAEAQSLESVVTDNAAFHQSYYREEMRYFSAINTAQAAPQDIRLFMRQKTGFEQFAARGRRFHRKAEIISGDRQDIKALIADRYVKNGRLVVSATALLPYYKCALLWLFKTVYRIEDSNAEAFLMSPFAKGTIYHEVMSRTFTAIKERKLALGLTAEGEIPPVFGAILEESASCAFAALPGGGESALTDALLLPQRDAVLEKCALLYAKMLKQFDSCTVAEVEPEPEWEAPVAAHENSVLTGRPDLILYDASGNHYTIIDFKSGKIPEKGACTGTEGEGIKNFQLPVYHHLAESKGLSPADAGFFMSIKDSKIAPVFYPPSDDEKKPSFEAVEEDFAYKIKRYVTEALEADFEKSYNKNYAECLRCDYRRICRTTSVIQQERRIGRRSRDAGL
jgi:hypothetical protein